MSVVWIVLTVLGILVVAWLAITIGVGLFLNWRIHVEQRRDTDELLQRGRLNQALGDRPRR